MKRYLILLLVIIAVAGLSAKAVENATSGTANPTDLRGVMVLSPNGGENWQTGSTHQIVWTFTETQGPFRIDLFRGEGSNTPPIVIAENVLPSPNGGGFTWTIPMTLTPAENYRIRIGYVAVDGTLVSDFSNGFFTISNSTPSALTIVSPNGGENWLAGSVHDIVWTTPILAGNVMIQLFRGENNAPVLTIAENVFISDCSYTWTLSATLAAGENYKVRISAANGTAVSDFSDNWFTISNEQPVSIVLTSPNGGENWALGSPHPITWTSAQTAGNVKIQLCRGLEPMPIINIANSLPAGAGTFNWVIPNNLVPAENFKIRIILLNTEGIFDDSNNCFAIGVNTNSFVNLTAPNGGENWMAGTAHPITWMSGNLDGSVRIELYRGENNATPVQIVAENVPVLGGVFNWLIPADITPAASNRIKIISLANPQIQDFSNGTFTIGPNNGSPLTLISPNGGEVINQGQIFPIAWVSASATPIAPVKLELFRGEQNVMVIANNVPSNFIFTWHVPQNLEPGNNYRVKVSLLTNTDTVFDFSNEPFIIASPAAVIRQK